MILSLIFFPVGEKRMSQRLKNILGETGQRVKISSDLELSLELIEITKDFNDINNIKNNISEMDNIIFSLENIMKYNTEDIGEKEYFHIVNHLTDISRRTGLDFKVPSFENFDGEYSTEGVKDVLDKIKNVAKKLKENLTGKVKNVFSKVSKFFEKNDTKIKRITDEIKSLNDKPKVEKIKISLKGLVAPNQSFKDFRNNLNNSAIEVKNYREDGDLIAEVALCLKNMTTVIEKCINEKKIKPLIPALNKIIKDFFTEVNAKVKTKSDNNDTSVINFMNGKTRNNFNIKKHGSLLGNNALYTLYPKNDFDFSSTDISGDLEDLKEDVDNSGVLVQRNTQGDKKEDIEEVDVLEKKDLEDLLKSITELYGYVRDMEKDMIPNVTSYSDVLNVAHRLDEEDYTDNDSVGGTVPWAITNIASKVFETLYYPRLDLVEVVMNNTLSILNFCDKNISAYKNGNSNE